MDKEHKRNINIKLIAKMAIFSTALIIFPCMAMTVQPEPSVTCDEGVISEPIHMDYGEHTIDCAFDEPTDLDQFSFDGFTGERVQLIFRKLSTAQLCVTIVDPDNQIIWGENCYVGSGIVELGELYMDGIYYVGIRDWNINYAGGYVLQSQCIGPCGNPPICNLALDLTYSDSTLTMDFFAGTSVPATWNILGFILNNTYPYISIPVPITQPPVSVSFSIPGLPSWGTIGVLTTLTTTEEGIICSDWKTVDTGPISNTEAVSTRGELKELFKNYQEMPD